MEDKLDKDMKSYGGYAQAIKYTVWRSTFFCVAISVYAQSLEEALGKALIYCRETFSENEGYTSHIVDVIEILPIENQKINH